MGLWKTQKSKNKQLRQIDKERETVNNSFWFTWILLVTTNSVQCLEELVLIQRHLYHCWHCYHILFLVFHHHHHHQVVQLVRDPRGILASRIETFRDTYRLWRLWRATGRRPHNLDLGQINTVCEDFLRSVSTGLARPAWLRGRYILLRWEGQRQYLWTNSQCSCLSVGRMTPNNKVWLKVGLINKWCRLSPCGGL